MPSTQNTFELYSSSKNSQSKFHFFLLKKECLRLLFRTVSVKENAIIQQILLLHRF